MRGSASRRTSSPTLPDRSGVHRFTKSLAPARQDSNLRLTPLRRRWLYPLSYGPFWRRSATISRITSGSCTHRLYSVQVIPNTSSNDFPSCR